MYDGDGPHAGRPHFGVCGRRLLDRSESRARDAAGRGYSARREADDMQEILFEERFRRGLDEWWVEGGEAVWTDAKEGLHVLADSGEPGKGHVCTVWCKRRFPPDISVEFDARVVESSIDANNLNFFLGFAGPAGFDLYATRGERADGAYSRYHELPGYIFTFLNDRHGESSPAPDGLPTARFRIRRCPGFRLLAERYGYRCREGEVYHVTISAVAGRLSLAVDGEEPLEAVDQEPLPGGYLAFRTFRTHAVWSDLVVRSLGRDDR